MLDQEHTLGDDALTELIVSVPYVLRFFPQDSLILLPVPSTKPGCFGAIRVNLTDPVGGVLPFYGLGSSLTCQGWDRVVVLVVGGESPVAVDVPPYQRLVDQIETTLHHNNVKVESSAWVPEIRQGARWMRYTEQQANTGTLSDPHSCDAAAQAASAREVTYGSLQDLVNSVTSEDADVLVRRRWQLSLLECHGAAAPYESVTSLARKVRRIDEAVLAADKGTLPHDDRQIVLLGRALSHALVWESCLGYNFTDHAHAAHRLWWHLTRCLPDRHAVEPAALLSLSSSMMGHTELAKVAARTAAAADPGDRKSVV